MRVTPEVVVATILLVGSLLGIIFMGYLVAPPKLLMGRALTAIMPGLFPGITFTGIALFCALFLVSLRGAPGQERGTAPTRSEWQRGIVFFGIMILYALTMEPIGFLFSSALAIVLLCLQMGNRSPIQIALLSVLSPVLIYLAATRLLAVSLPELNAIELLYSRVLG
ncbi:MAG: tripartite tricarboxylate transporter TctB family protein [Hoeflea sp.]|uniref:tripartite tricarboxylate transporter TctB family protein n=1 Tax=Hoeflea sp. TaxID=1940281 RepID=UPI003EF76DA4